MINYNKNKLINETLDKYYETFSHTLDTADYVPEKFNTKISKYIFKNMKNAFKRIDKEDRNFQKNFNKKLKNKQKTTKKPNIFIKIKEKFKKLLKMIFNKSRKDKSTDSNLKSS